MSDADNSRFFAEKARTDQIFHEKEAADERFFAEQKKREADRIAKEAQDQTFFASQQAEKSKNMDEERRLLDMMQTALFLRQFSLAVAAEEEFAAQDDYGLDDLLMEEVFEGLDDFGTMDDADWEALMADVDGKDDPQSRYDDMGLSDYHNQDEQAVLETEASIHDASSPDDTAEAAPSHTVTRPLADTFPGADAPKQASMGQPQRRAIITASETAKISAEQPRTKTGFSL